MRNSLFALVIALGMAATALPQAQTPPAPPRRAGVKPRAPRPPQPPPYNCEPVNANATPEARALLKTLCDISGKGIFSGQHEFPNHRDQDTSRVHEITGEYPAVWGSDFGFTGGEDKDSILHRDLMVQEAIQQHADGAIITLCWHMTRPTEDEPVEPGIGWRDSVQARLTDEQWEELITPDTPLHKRWERYIDTAAGYLKQLQDANVPVLWRPMHENNGGFFWWGGRPGPAGTAQLWRELYARMTYVHGLNNLIWVWNQNGPAPIGEFNNFFPGQKWVDVVSHDNYRELKDEYYYSLLALAEGKPVALGELGRPPTADELERQPRWTWFMIWGGMAREQTIGPIYQNPYVIHRGGPLPVN